MLVIHYTGMQSAFVALDRLCSPAAKVSAHYLIDEDGQVAPLVDEYKRAWHAGVAVWRGETDINARSIGVELVNPGHEFGYRNFPEIQMAALVDLATGIFARHPIAPRNVVGHSDVAPARKTDPGELFDWAALAQAGIGLWPGDGEPLGVDEAQVLEWLAVYGYDTSNSAQAITAFQRHFRPQTLDGRADAETAGRLKALLVLCR
ncbi:MAG: N-acetylmuramoyl-L-alanine amidase [Rhodospirillales bacterium]|nr:N-acetylmuramoyl-L-alanine amidase [Rhodospirillales bacterium]